MSVGFIARTTVLLTLSVVPLSTEPIESAAIPTRPCTVIITTTNVGGSQLPVGVQWICSIVSQGSGVGDNMCMVTQTPCTMSVKTMFSSTNPRYTGEVCDPNGCSNCGTNCPATIHNHSEDCNKSTKPFVNLNMHDSQSNPSVIKRTSHQITSCDCVP